MNVLHVATGFAAHPLYRQLIRHLRDYCSSQTVFAAVRSDRELLSQPADEPGLVAYRYRRVLKPYHRLFFRTKVRTVLGELCRTIDRPTFDVVHAHTLYSDGAVALQLRRKWSAPFIVAVRNTDLNAFMPLRPDLRPVAHAVLREASRVIFISPSYRENLLSRLRGALRKEVEEKSTVVPNGLSSRWLACGGERVRAENVPLRLLFVGSFTKNKNLRGILEASARVAARMPTTLTLVGSGREERYVRRCMARREFSFVNYRGRVDDESALRAIYRDHDIFVMPSFTETFGVVYLEALSQGLPVIHSHGQGIDGFFSRGTVCEAVNPRSSSDIARGIEALAGRLALVRTDCMIKAQEFSWTSVARAYSEIYRRIASAN